MFDINKYKNKTRQGLDSGALASMANQFIQTPQNNPQGKVIKLSEVFKDPKAQKPMNAIETFDSIIAGGSAPPSSLSKLADNAYQNVIKNPIDEYKTMGNDALNFVGLRSSPTLPTTGSAALPPVATEALPAIGSAPAAAASSPSVLSSVGSFLAEM